MPTPPLLVGIGSARTSFGDYRMYKIAPHLARSESGSNALEYGLIVGLISLAIVAGATTAGTGMNTLFTTVATAITTAVAAVSLAPMTRRAAQKTRHVVPGAFEMSRRRI